SVKLPAPHGRYNRYTLRRRCASFYVSAAVHRMSGSPSVAKLLAVVACCLSSGCLSSHPRLISFAGLKTPGPATSPSAPVESTCGFATDRGKPSGAPTISPVIAITTLPPPSAIPVIPTDLAELLRVAMENSPSLKQAAADVAAARGAAIQAGLNPNPTVGYQGDQIGSDHTAGQQGAFV